MNMSKEEYHKRVNKMYSELRTDRVDADREEVIRCQRLYLAEDRYIPSCEREIERLNNIIEADGRNYSSLVKEWKKQHNIINKTSEELQKIIDEVNNKTLINVGKFAIRLENIQDELVGGSEKE